jgi:hypothetical protein
MGEIGLEVGKDEADEAESGSGVEAAAGSCGVKQCTAVKRRKERWNANDGRIDVIAATVESALEPENEVERKRASERRGDLGLLSRRANSRIPPLLAARAVLGLAGTATSTVVHETCLPGAYCRNITKV